jgi:hypothetical protein
MYQVVFMQLVKIADAPFFQLKVMVKFQKCLPAIGFKIPEGMVQVKEEMFVLH